MFSEPVQKRSTGGRAAQGERTRQRVLATAEDLFRARGFAATSIRDIAAGAKVSVGTVMAVGDKNGLLVAVYDEWIAAAHRDREQALPGGLARVVDAATAVPESSVTDAVMMLLAPFLRFFATDRALSRRYAAIVVGEEYRSTVFAELGPLLIEEIATVLWAANSAQGKRAIDPDKVARAIYFAYIGVLLVARGADAVPREDVQIRDAVATILGESPAPLSDYLAWADEYLASGSGDAPAVSNASAAGNEDVNNNDDNDNEGAWP